MIVAARPAPLAAGGRLGAEVPGRGERPTARRCTSWFLDLLRRSRILALGRRGAAPARRAGQRARAPRRRRRRPRARRAAARRRLRRCSLLLGAAGALLAWGALDAGAAPAAAAASTRGAASLWRRLLTLGRVLLATALGHALGASRPAWPSGSRRGCRASCSRWCRWWRPSRRRCSSRRWSRCSRPLGVGARLGQRRAHAARAPSGTSSSTSSPARPPSRPTCARRRAATASARWQRFRTLYLPAVFPYLVTGWVTAAGGAWNASIVAEYVSFRGEVARPPTASAPRISAAAAASGDFAVLGRRDRW